jgi:hypothetical protein
MDHIDIPLYPIVGAMNVVAFSYNLRALYAPCEKYYEAAIE